jgi:threonine dehydrogenase-like Zn-dependent dehydrogenase
VRGLLVEGGAVAYRDDLPAPETGRGECRVRVLRAGVCATDLALVRGYMGFRGIPGHEFVGEALDGPLAGRRVVGEINAGCGECAQCRKGDPRHCANRSVLGILGRPGAFAEELALPAANLRAVPDGVSSDAATFAEPLAAAFEIAAQLDLADFSRAGVVGDGRLGLLCAHVLARSGLEVEVVGRHPERARLLPDGVSHRPALPEGRPWDLAVEATGRPESLQAVLARVRPRGTVVLKTTAEAPATLDLAPLVVDELALLGSRCGPFEPALLALAEGAIPVERFIHARFPLEEGARAFAEAARPGVLKVLVDVGEARVGMEAS